MRKALLSCVVLLFMLVGCHLQESSNLHNDDWHPTKEQAIESGLKQEGTDESSLLSVENYEGETIVFFEIDGALSIANIVESSAGYSWIRSNPFYDVQVEGVAKDLPYMSAGFEFETNKGTKGAVLYGKVFDSSIRTMNLLGDGEDRELKVFNDSRLFYSLHEQPFAFLEVVAVKE